MRIIPVLDLMRGQVVRGVGGRRQEYRPIVSRLTSSSNPIDVACAFRENFGLTELYVADLDAIGGEPPALPIYGTLREQGFRLWVDAGLRHAADAAALCEAGVETIVAGLESLAGPEALEELCQGYLPGRLLFSLDLKDGQSLGDSQAWGASLPLEIAGRAVRCGIRRLLVLDLGHVGMGNGIGTDDLCRSLLRAYPGVELVVGGGIRGPEELGRLRESGVHGVLVASALHDGRLRSTDL
jgi:phosphoribosylformimino-5-aminoimidazole carboxamide ribotide isomerase